MRLRPGIVGEAGERAIYITSFDRAYQGKGTGEHGLFRGLKKCFVEGDVM